MKKKSIALYPGTFDPVTFGHIDIMRRALKIFDQLAVAVALNPNKRPLFSLDNRVEFIKEATKNLKNIEVIPISKIVQIFVKNGTNLLLILAMKRYH